MRKNATKVVAALLSAALVVTSVTVPGVKSEAASIKISKKTAKAYISGPSSKKKVTLKVTKGSKVLTKKCTWSSSKKKVATVKKGVVTAKKAGTAVIRAKYKGKTYKCKVTVAEYKYVTKVKASQSSVSIGKGKSQALTISLTPKKATTQKISVKSSNTGVVKVKKNSNKKITLTGVSKGEATVTVSATKASGAAKKTVKTTVKVTVTDDSATQAPATTAPATTDAPTEAPTFTPDVVGTPDKVEGNLTNSIKDYANTLLAGTTGTIKFAVTDKDGQPVKNETVTLTLKQQQAPDGIEYSLDGEHVVKVVTTDENGIARVALAPEKVIRTNKQRAAAVGSYQIDAICASDESVKTSVVVSVGAIVYADKEGDSVKNTTDKDNLIAGTNAGTNLRGTANTKNMNGETVNYVYGQQVSANGETKHAVTFDTAAYISLPRTDADENLATKYTQKIDYKSGAYATYAGIEKNIDFEKTDFSDLRYVTLYFDNINLSKYTKVWISKYKYTEDGIKDGSPSGSDTWSSVTSYGNDSAAYNSKKQALQIDKNDLVYSWEDDVVGGTPTAYYDGIQLKVVSEGQVDKNNCQGIEATELEYVFKDQSSAKAVVKPLASVNVTWETYTPVYSTVKSFANDGALDTQLGNILTANETAEYVVPAFPRVGNGIVTVYNANKEVLRYYAVPTKNEDNANVLGNKAYQITQNEAEDAVGELTTDGTKVTVNSTKSGTTFLKGTLSSTDENVVLDATNTEVYTYVMWNPIQNTETTSNAFIAVKGQTVKAEAQLYDKNGNKMTTKDIKIDFQIGGKSVTADGKYGNAGGTAAGYAADDVNNVVVKEISTVTDKNGAASLVLQGNGMADLVGLTATSKDPKYIAKIVVAGTDVDSADIYWVDLGLKYKDKVNGTDYETLTNAEGKLTVSETSQKYGINDAWKVGTTTGLKGYFLDGTLKDKTKRGVSDNSVKIAAKAGDGSKGTVTQSDVNGMVEVTSAKGGKGSIVYTLDKTSITKDTKFYYANNDWSGYTTVNCVGEGDASISQTLTINYVFGEDSVKINGGAVADPMGITISAIGNPDAKSFTTSPVADRLTYVQVTDAFGTPKANENVEFTITVPVGSNAVIKQADGTVAVGGVVATTTDDKGYAAVLISGVDLAGAYELKAELPDQTDSKGKINLSTTYNFKAFKSADDLFGFDVDKTTFAEDKITIAFNKDLLKSSVEKDMIGVKFSPDGTTPAGVNTQIKNIDVSGKNIVITMKSAIFSAAGVTDNAKVEVTFGTNVKVTGKSEKILYNLTSADGQNLSSKVQGISKVAKDKKAAVTLTTESQDKVTAVNNKIAAIVIATLQTDPTDSTEVGNVHDARAAYDALEASDPDLVAYVDSEKYATLVKAEGIIVTKTIEDAIQTKTATDLVAADTAYQALKDKSGVAAAKVTALEEKMVAKDVALAKAVVTGVTNPLTASTVLDFKTAIAVDTGCGSTVTFVEDGNPAVDAAGLLKWTTKDTANGKLTVDPTAVTEAQKAWENQYSAGNKTYDWVKVKITHGGSSETFEVRASVTGTAGQLSLSVANP